MKIVELYEGRGHKELSLEEVITLFKGDYSDATSLFKKPLFRGTSNKPEMFQYSKATTKREPLDGGQFYTKLLETNFKNSKWPSRVQSTICSTSDVAAKSFGTVYHLFPKNNTSLAVLNNADMWYVPLKTPRLPNSTAEEVLYSFSKMLKQLKINPNDLTIDNLVSKLEEVKNDRLLINMQFGILKNFNDFIDEFKKLDLEKLFSYKSLGAELINIRDAHKLPENSEVWFLGKALLIRDTKMASIIQHFKERT